MPAYVVFHDRSLIEMARLRPRTEEEFAEIGGVGAAKLEAFAEPFLAAIDEALTGEDAVVPERDVIGEAGGFSPQVQGE